MNKLKVVLDTNVVISAALSVDSNPAKIFELLLLESIENYTSDEIIEEIRDVFDRPKIVKRLSLVERNFIINNFVKFSRKVNSCESINAVQDDPDDNKFVECAVTANAHYIVSGDIHLKSLKEFQGIKILSPIEFLRIM